jgi:hypothetical protein
MQSLIVYNSMKDKFVKFCFLCAGLLVYHADRNVWEVLSIMEIQEGCDAHPI